MSDTSENEEPYDPFDAFRARRAQEQAENEPFPESYPAAQYETPQFEAPEYESSAYEPTQFVAEPTQYVQPLPVTQGQVAGGVRGRLRSVAVLAGAAVLVAGVVGGVYAATRSSGSPAAAAVPGASSTPTATPSAGATKGAKNGKAVTARLTVTSVGADSFDATAADGRTVSVHITSSTKFGTAARPFDRSQLVTGAVVFARLRREADGTVVATVIASVTANKGDQGSPSASATATAGA